MAKSANLNVLPVGTAKTVNISVIAQEITKRGKFQRLRNQMCFVNVIT